MFSFSNYEAYKFESYISYSSVMKMHEVPHMIICVYKGDDFSLHTKNSKVN